MRCGPGNRNHSWHIPDQTCISVTFLNVWSTQNAFIIWTNIQQNAVPQGKKHARGYPWSWLRIAHTANSDPSKARWIYHTKWVAVVYFTKRSGFVSQVPKSYSFQNYTHTHTCKSITPIRYYRDQTFYWWNGFVLDISMAWPRNVWKSKFSRWFSSRLRVSHCYRAVVTSVMSKAWIWKRQALD